MANSIAEPEEEAMSGWWWWIAGCDIDEGPREETREAVEAIGEGQDAELVREQIEDLRPRSTARRDLDQELRKSEEWLARAAGELETETKTASAEARRELEELEREAGQLRAELDRLGAEAEAEWEQASEALEARVRALGRRVDELDGE
jgi:DNA repair exonuclease SbcCD ATPase subunit